MGGNMAWSHIIFYATAKDADLLRCHVNDDPDVLWIVKDSERDRHYRWRAVKQLDVLLEQDYALWHRASGPLNVPSGAPAIPDAVVQQPEKGWEQILNDSGCTRPWFGVNPAPYFLHLRFDGREAPAAIARSEFAWAADHFKPLGWSAAPGSKAWWRELKRFVETHAEARPWPPVPGSTRKAYVFPQAAEHVANGGTLDLNPS